MKARRDRRHAASAWRRAAAVGVLVVLLHAALLWGLRLQPVATPDERSLVVTQAALIAPPRPAPASAPETAPPAPAGKPPPKRTATAPAKPAPARTVPSRPETKPVPAYAARSPLEADPTPSRSPSPSPSPSPSLPDAAVADASAPAAPTASTPPTASASSAPAAGNAAGTASESADRRGGNGGANHIHPSTRLNFEMVALRGVQPWKGVFGQLDWRQEGDRYEASLALKVLFRTVRAQVSTGRIVDGALAPERFSETRRQDEVAQLQHGESKVVFSNGAPSATLRPGAQDRLSVVMQLGALLAADESRLRPGSRIPIQVVGTKDAEDWTFEILEDDTVSVPAGQFRAHHLIRTPRRPDDYRMDIWLAPELGYLPVQMRQTQQNGDVIDLLLRDISPL